MLFHWLAAHTWRREEEKPLKYSCVELKPTGSDSKWGRERSLERAACVPVPLTPRHPKSAANPASQNSLGSGLRFVSEVPVLGRQSIMYISSLNFIAIVLISVAHKGTAVPSFTVSHPAV